MSRGFRCVAVVIILFALCFVPTIVLASQYAKVIVVAQAGGDFTDPIAAMDSIVDASATNRYLVQIMPGIYNIQNGRPLEVKQYVDVKGSGKNNTIIKTYGAVYGGIFAHGENEISSIAVEAIFGTGNDVNHGIYSVGSNNTISDVIVTVSGYPSSGIQISSSATTLDNITINASFDTSGSAFSRLNGLDLRGTNSVVNNIIVNLSDTGTDPVDRAYGLYVSGSGSIKGITINATGLNQSGIWASGNSNISWSTINGSVVNSGGTTKVDSSVVSGNVRTEGTYPGTLSLGASRISSVTAGSGNIKIVNCYNNTYTPIPNGFY